MGGGGVGVAYRVQIEKEVIFILIFKYAIINKNPKLNEKTKTHQQFQQSSRIQNHLTKLSNLSIYQSHTNKEIMETLSFIIISKKLKYLGINLAKYVKDLHNDNFINF